MNDAVIYCDECKQPVEVPAAVASDQLDPEKLPYVCTECIFKDELL